MHYSSSPSFLMNLSDRIVFNNLLKFGNDFDDTITAAEFATVIRLPLLPLILALLPSCFWLLLLLLLSSPSQISVRFWPLLSSVVGCFCFFLFSPVSSSLSPLHTSSSVFARFLFSRLSVCSLELVYRIRHCSSSKQENRFRDTWAMRTLNRSSRHGLW